MSEAAGEVKGLSVVCSDGNGHGMRYWLAAVTAVTAMPAMIIVIVECGCVMTWVDPLCAAYAEICDLKAAISKLQMEKETLASEEVQSSGVLLHCDGHGCRQS